MFEGAYDTPPVAGKDHYGAWDPVSHHIHFDPSHLANLSNITSNDAYQVANTAMHEVLHNMGYDHPHGFTIMNYHGKSPLYTDWPFSQLNPRMAESCMK
jgi:hypothetical protein